MIETIIRFFLTRKRLNYTLFVFLIILGVVSYQTIPKDVFPPLKMDKIVVTGHYAGASIGTLDKMAVSNLEKDIKSLSGIEKLEAFIKNGGFTIIASLEQGSDKLDILNKTKDIISNNRKDLPQDMDEPVAFVLDWTFPLINITLSSNSVGKQKLIEVANEIKDTVSSIQNISKVNLYEDTTMVFEILLDSKKIALYDLNKNLLFQELKQISHIYPIGKIEGKGEHLYLRTSNGKKEVEAYLNTLIKIGGKRIYLSDIAKVVQKYKQTDIISKMNGEYNVQISTSKNDKANAITLVKEVKDEIKRLDALYPDIHIETFYDTSIYIKNRLNTVISGILFGLILVTIAMYILINKRVAFIVVMGIPTAILFGVVVLSFTSYSINMMTLIGALLILGVLVDDAVIIAENIQRHIMMGDDKLQSAIDGTKEVALPVLASSLTTVFAFLPMMMLTNEIGQFLLLIPVAIIILIIASLIESFVFLPIHSLHILHTEDKELDWSKAQAFYSRVLHKVIEYRKSFLTAFIIVIPLITIALISSMKFQMFPDFDGDKIFVEGRFDPNHSVQQTYEKSKIIEQILLKHKDELGIKTISYANGYKETDMGVEIKQSLFQFLLELHTRKPENFVNEYITPLLSFNGDDSPKIRELSVNEILLRLNELLKEYKPVGLQEFIIKKESSGVTANDIEILLSTKNQDLLLQTIQEIEKQLKSIKGITAINNTAKFGVKELQINLNSYGESLGFNEALIAATVSPLFLKLEQTKGLNADGIFEIISYGIEKDDFETLKDLKLNIPDTQQKISLSQICDFVYINNFDSIKKVNKMDVKMVTANVNNNIMTAIEVLDMLQATFDKYRELGVRINLEGEQEQNERMAKEMTYAFFIAISLMFITLLLMFDSFRLTFMILSIIPFSVLGAIIGHLILGMNLSLTSVIGILGLAGVVINNAIVMIEFIKNSKSLEDVINRAKLRLRPIVITSITTFLGLTTLMFFATGQAKVLQPIAISLGFGLIWGTILTLIYLPTLFAMSRGGSFRKS